MVVKGAQTTKEPPRKRPRLDPKKPVRKFASIEEIRAGLRTQSPEGLTETLTTLRNQLYVKPSEDAVSPQDERLLLVQHWMENVPGAHDMFEIWDNTAPRQTSALALIVSVLSSLLSLLSSHYTFHTLGLPILKTLLTPTYTRRLNSYLGTSHSELILTTLKLYNEMSAFARGRERNAVLDAFGWEIKSLPKILNMRRKTKGEEIIDSLARPDIRTLYILFLLSFVDTGSSTQTKTTFLDQHRDAFLSIFKGLVQDSYPVARKILEVCWSGVWSDPKIKRTMKIGLFNETTISHITKLYERTASEGDEEDQIPADLVHHFLLAICTRPGVGICFKDRGWYPRETDSDERIGKEEDDYEPTKRGGRIYNKILSNILKALKVNEDVRQQELALKILSACPELVAGYWSGAALTLEPRLSSKWIANISLFGSIICLPIPSESFRLPGSTLYQPTPPPLNAIMENILPSVNTKAHFSKGLLSPSGLVQHCTALALAKCLDKYQQVVTLFNQIETILEENEADGQWSKRRRDIERETRRRVPEFQVIVAFTQQKFGEGSSMTGAPTPTAPPNPIKAALLSESAQRLLWMYHRCLPLVVAEARFDVGKLLQNFSVDLQVSKVNEDKDNQDEPLDAATKINMVRQLHVLRLLKDSDQFTWSGKMGSSSQSYLAVLLKAYTVSDHPATRSALASLLNHILAQSIMFQEDPDEPHLWLASLPTSRRSPGSESPDGASLTDEADGVISFLDDCVQRCMKTPYRYIEELYSFNNPENPGSNEGFSERFDLYPSPLLMTVLEQLDIKIEKNILSPSDVLALGSFLRKLVYNLMTKQQSLQFLQCVLRKIDGILDPSRLFPQYPVITGAIRREVSLLRTCLGDPQASSSQTSPHNQPIKDFLDQVEKLPIPVSKRQRALSAYELIDWVRMVDQTLSSSELRRVSDIIFLFNPPTISELAEYTDPAQGSLWSVLNIRSRFSEIQKYLNFHSLFLRSNGAEIEDAACRKILVEVAFGDVSLLASKRAFSLVIHRLAAARTHETLAKGLLLLLSSMMERASTVFSAEDTGVLKEAVFVHSEVIRAYLTSEEISEPLREVLHELVKVSCNPTSQSDQLILADTIPYWLSALKRSMTGEPIKNELILIWISYFKPSDLLGILDTLSQTISPSKSTSLVLETMLHSLRSLTSTNSTDLILDLKARLPQLISLRKTMPDLAVLEDIIALAVASSLPAYCGGSRLSGKPFEETLVSPIIAQSELRWSQHLSRLPDDLSLQSFLEQATWTASTVEILSSLLYRRLISKGQFMSWLETRSSTQHPIEQLILVLHAFLDVSFSEETQIENPNIDVWAGLAARLAEVASNGHASSELESMSSSCIILIVSLVPSCLPQILTRITTMIDALPVTLLTRTVLDLGRRLQSVSPVNTAPLVAALTNHGMQWAVRHFAEEDEPLEGMVDELTRLVHVSSDVKPHLVETVIGVVIQHHLGNVSALKLITSLLSVVQFKPLTVNRFLQSIIQHPQIFKLGAHTTSSSHASRDAVINTLYVLFHLHPHNTCQLTHVEPMVKLYQGTLSPADGQILAIFRLFETQRKMSIAPLLNRWSSSPDLPSSTPLDAVHSLDPIVVLRTCLSFPAWRRLEDPLTVKATTHDAQLYDPMFLILLFSQTITESPPSSAFTWVELFRTNIVSLLIRAMSSRDDGIREAALCQLSVLYKCLMDADLQEKPHVTYILTLLKNLLPAPSSEPAKRLPSYTTLLLAHALRGVFYPSNFIYPLTARFLLQRPELDITDVPMLYNMLYSSTDDWKKERGWIIRFLSDGMISTEDWRVLKRRHTWDLLASLFQSSESDHALRRGVLEILANLTCNTQAITSLVLKSGLLVWIEMQLVTSKQTETVEWIKILENIITIGNSAKLELSTNGEWRNVVGRCLAILMHPDRTSNSPGVLPFALSAFLRLVLLDGPRITNLSLLLDHGLAFVKNLEPKLVIPPSHIQTHNPKLAIPNAPFRAHDIHELYLDEDNLQLWGSAVETLWRISMTLEDKSRAWDALTTRLLIWRAIVGVENSSLGEWARKQVVRSMTI